MRRLIAQLVRFGLVGGVGFIVDLGVFNLLRATVFSPDAVAHGPIYAKIVSTVLAIAVNWIGNRYWTFGDRKRPNIAREGLEFALVSGGGLVIGLGCLWISHYVLGFTSVLADNISSNVIGLVLGTAFRFTFYRLWVFREEKNDPPRPLTLHEAHVPARADDCLSPASGLPRFRSPPRVRQQAQLAESSPNRMG